MKRQRAGFTLVETMVAASLSSLVIIGALTAFRHAALWTRAGGYQVQFNAMARAASRRVAQHVENGKAVGVSTNGLDIITADMRVARIYLDDGGDINRVSNNRLMFDPDTSISGNEQVLCSYVSPVEGVELFSILQTSPSTARVVFHVGDGTNQVDQSFSGTGQGYQGVDVRISATPRNLQRWYEY